MPNLDISPTQGFTKLLSTDQSGETYQGLAPRPELCTTLALATSATLAIDCTNISCLRLLPTGTISISIGAGATYGDFFPENTEVTYICANFDTMILRNDAGVEVTVFQQGM